MERRVIIFIYRLLQAIGGPFLLLYLLARVWRDGRYRHRLSERFGFLPIQATQRGGVWLHAVSVGEVLSAVAVLKQLRQQLPGTPLYVSVTTVAGRALADERLRDLADGIFFAPIDYCFAVRRALRALDPLALVVLETEIWPNLWNETRRRGAGLVVINGRISDKAWPKYLRWRWAFGAVLRLPNRIYAQSAQDAERYRLLGAQAVEPAGNLKYDIEVPAPQAEVAAWIRAQGAAKIFVAASTMPAVTAEDRDEDEIVLAAFRTAAREFPKLLLVLAPRRPERFGRTAELLRREGVQFVRRSALGALALPGVLLLDSMGELAGLFELADAVFVGGSLVHWGGHNVLEPAASGRPILVGPHMQNFAAIFAEFREAQALLVVEKPEELGAAIVTVLREPGLMGENARQAAARHRGATAGAVQAIIAVMDASVTRETGRRWLTPFCWLWHAGVAVDRWRRSPGKAVGAPVISIGNLTLGGTGKTPVVDWLARNLTGSAILTRGYRRESTEDLVLTPGAPATVQQTGDEAQVYLRSGAAVVGIGADRCRVAGQVLSRHPPQRFLLDDGFQHWPIRRGLDVVLVDVTDPFGGGHLLPRGRLREPVGALGRAGLILLTRTEKGRSYSGLTAQIRAVNALAPVRRVRMVPVGWMRGDVAAQLPEGPLAAVCGLANPGAFAATLRDLGIRPARFTAFPDHHAHSRAEVAQAGQGMAGVVTTEKDWAKLAGLALEVPVFWLKIDVQVDEAAGVLESVRKIGN